ncbi:hypothetical protein B0A79_05560 [Flavobacterium piscis]|uniref:Uncharacterized protein n=1 Tax=Flavobacterium piscis TaxID=1114874 RepID=A0ABX2XM75_9FLAO|nr:hypothetical protein FLP_05135 [Flavobacterium piscis]OXG06403.1 hypothetical protein B0A79_05560 [Flavobacterium piscis]
MLFLNLSLRRKLQIQLKYYYLVKKMPKKYIIKNIKACAIGCAKIQKYANKKIKNNLFSCFALLLRY